MSFIFFAVYLPAQTVRARVDCFSTGSYHERFTDVFSTTANPAALVYARPFTAGVYAGRRFLNTVRHFILAAAIPAGKDGLGIQADHITAPSYAQSAVGLGYAKTLGQAAIGARFHYHRIMVAAYGSIAGMAVEAGSNWHITDDIRVAMCIYLPAGGKVKPAYYYRGGMAWAIADQLLLMLEASKEENRRVNIHAGIYYRPTPRITLQSGITTGNAQPYVAAWLQWNQLRVLVSVIYSMQLGGVPGIAVIYAPPAIITP
ncbi:MAG TPA: hypothetical protein VD993_09700 [Chitinophagaceae bacterium]|nr:hypothetical protein [Chitinophagaceae bacterium]